MGEAFLGVDSKNNFFVENFLARLPPDWPDWPDDGVGAGGDIMLDGS